MRSRFRYPYRLRFYRSIHWLWLVVLCFAGAAPAQLAAWHDSLIGIQYEPWFYGAQSWKTAEAVPLLGKYTTDPPTIAKHFAEFEQLGFDWLLLDWSNMLRMQPAWEQHVGETHRLEDKTAVVFETARQLRQQGKYAPRLVFMLGLQNGLPVPDGVERLNGMLAWLKQNYLDRPEYKDLWLYDGGKPLLTILFITRDSCADLKATIAAGKLHTQDWTVRWMASQLQNSHAEQCGMWSWMDGVIPQVLTRRDGAPEAIVVTPAAFQLPAKGWTAPSAIARDHGVPYLESWKPVFALRPKYVQVHQWNEFAGHDQGPAIPAAAAGANAANAPLPSQVYGDEYNAQLSDDLEPTDPQACAYRGCGGWGYYYYNLTRAIISLYRGASPDITVLALSGPTAPVDASAPSLDLHWAFLGKTPTSYSISLDGKVVAASLTGSAYTLDLRQLARGEHRIQLTAAGVHTRFSLDPSQPAAPSQNPLPVTAEVTFTYGAPTPAR